MNIEVILKNAKFISKEKYLRDAHFFSSTLYILPEGNFSVISRMRFHKKIKSYFLQMLTNDSFIENEGPREENPAMSILLVGK